MFCARCAGFFRISTCEASEGITEAPWNRLFVAQNGIRMLAVTAWLYWLKCVAAI
jgi:hypothetical protein